MKRAFVLAAALVCAINLRQMPHSPPHIVTASRLLTVNRETPATPLQRDEWLPVRRQFAVRASRGLTRATQPKSAHSGTRTPAEVSTRCGGDLPPCSVMRRESGGDIRIWNGRCYAPVGWAHRSPCGSSSASGKWQVVRGSWARFGGYLNAADAPEEVQDAKARALWAGGRGCGHWRACGVR